MPRKQSCATVSHFIDPSRTRSGAAQTVRLGARAHLLVVKSGGHCVHELASTGISGFGVFLADEAFPQA